MRRLSLALCAVLSFGATAAGAQSSMRSTALSVGAGQAARITLSAPVRDVVVGDPTVADVSLINERTLVVLGKKTGATTILAFDARGQALADRQVVVSDIPSEGVVVQRGGKAVTYACADRCSALEAKTDSAPDAPK